jgi:hypothetical protein
MELRGDVHGGRFVNGYAGEQFALPSVPNLLKAASLDYESKGPAISAQQTPSPPALSTTKPPKEPRASRYKKTFDQEQACE